MAYASDNVVSNETIFKDFVLRGNFIGSGSFGRVFGPCDWRDKKCAIKERLYTKVDEKVEKDRGACQKWMRLEHRNLIAVYDVTLESLALYVVMEFASAGSLKDFLEGCKSDIPLEFLMDWGKQIAEGMAYLHENNIVHRDLKSPNIVLMDSDPASNPYDRTLKITDFDQIREHDHTTKMTCNGTYAWAAPEVVDGQKFSKASDVWSFGVVLWEILTRKIPHHGVHDTEILKKILAKKLKLEIEYSCPDSVKRILIRCLHYNRNSRASFDTLRQFLTDPHDPVLRQLSEEEINKSSKTSGLLIKDKTTVLQSDGASGSGNQQQNHQPAEHETRIQRHYDILSKRLNVPDVETLMFQQEKLTSKQHEHLRTFRATPTVASEELLSIVMKSPRDVYECFLQSLQKTKQHELHQQLTSDGSSDEIKLLRTSEHGRLIQQNYNWLIQTLCSGIELVTNLLSKGVLNDREYDQLSAEKEDFEKNDLLLTIISRKSAGHFQKFITALNETNQQHVAARLIGKRLGLKDPGDIDAEGQETEAVPP